MILALDFGILDQGVLVKPFTMSENWSRNFDRVI